MATNMLWGNVTNRLQVLLNRCTLGVSSLLENHGFIFEPAIVMPALRGMDSHHQRKEEGNGDSLQELFDGFLWAVPKHRRSIQRNRGRRRAIDKRITFNENLVPCETCGNLRQAGYLCGHCLVRIREETKQIQDQMFVELDKEGVLPDKENIVLYEGEALAEGDKDKWPVEIKKKRPAWFSRDLIDDLKKW